MRAITICMLVVLAVIGTTLWAQNSDMAKERGPVKMTTYEDWKRPVVSSLVEGVGTLGISVRVIDPNLRRQLGLPEGFGIEVDRVNPSSPAEQAGLKMGDVIVTIDDQWVSNTYQFKALIRHLGPGHKARILVKSRREYIEVAGKLYPKDLGTTKQIIVTAILGKTNGGPLVDPAEPLDWSTPVETTIRHKGCTFHFRDDMVQAINAEGVIRFQGKRGLPGSIWSPWIKFLPKDEFTEMIEYVTAPSGKVISIGYEAVEEKRKDDKPEQASKKKP